MAQRFGRQPIDDQPIILKQQPHRETHGLLDRTHGSSTALEILNKLDHFLVKQERKKLNPWHATPNKYIVESSSCQSIFLAQEVFNKSCGGCCVDTAVGSSHGFGMKILDSRNLNGMEVIHLDKTGCCVKCFFPCCLQKMSISSPFSSEFSGSIKQKWHP